MSGKVRLVGAPEEVGRIYGGLLAPQIRGRVASLQDAARGREAETRRKAEALGELLAKEAPHWIREYEAVARAAEVDFRDLLALNCAAPLTAGTSCTSALVGPDRARGGRALLVKVRDERPQHQAMGYRRIGGTLGTLFGADSCNLGLGQGCNERGLAVANNSGGLVLDAAEPVGLDDCHVTRLLLERAETTDEALEVLRSLQAKGRIGLVDGVRGMIFLLADRRGKGLVIEASRKGCAWKIVERGVAVWSNHWLLPGSREFAKEIDPENPLQRSSTLRLQRGCALLEGKDLLDARDLEAFASDGANEPFSICNGSDAFPWRTVSAFVYEMDPEGAAPVRVAAGLPSRTRFKDVPWWSEETPEKYLLEYGA